MYNSVALLKLPFEISSQNFLSLFWLFLNSINSFREFNNSVESLKRLLGSNSVAFFEITPNGFSKLFGSFVSMKLINLPSE